MSHDKLRAVYDARVASTASANRQACPTPEQLQQLASSGKGASATNLTMLDHVFGCAHCRPEFAIFRALQAEVDAAPWMSVAHTKPAGRWFSASRVAIAASVLIAFGVGGEFLLRVQARGAATIVRNSAGAANDVILVTPLQNVSGAQFVWRNMTGTATYEVQVLDTAGAVLATRVTPDTVYTPTQAERERIERAGTFDWFVAAKRSDGNERRSNIARVHVGASVRR